MTYCEVGRKSRNRLAYEQAHVFCTPPLEDTIELQRKRSVRQLPHNKWLMMIALYKLAQAIAIAAIGFGALHLLHKDIGELMQQVASGLRFNPESRLVNFILDKAAFIDDPLLRRIGLVAFGFATISLIESVGLYLEKAWGELLTLFITASFLPWEVFEVFKRITWIRVSLLIVNVLVFLYLLKVVVERKTRPGDTERSPSAKL